MAINLSFVNHDEEFAPQSVAESKVNGSLTKFHKCVTSPRRISVQQNKSRNIGAVESANSRGLVCQTIPPNLSSPSFSFKYFSENKNSSVRFRRNRVDQRLNLNQSLERNIANSENWSSDSEITVKASHQRRFIQPVSVIKDKNCPPPSPLFLEKPGKSGGEYIRPLSDHLPIDDCPIVSNKTSTPKTICSSISSQRTRKQLNSLSEYFSCTNSPKEIKRAKSAFDSPAVSERSPVAGRRKTRFREQVVQRSYSDKGRKSFPHSCANGILISHNSTSNRLSDPTKASTIEGTFLQEEAVVETFLNNSVSHKADRASDESMASYYQHSSHSKVDEDISPQIGRTTSDGSSSNPQKSFDEILFDMLKVSPEDYAKQLTLLDLAVFKSITPDEIAGGGWTKKNKWKLTPNICAMTQRFNNTSFWVIREILNASTLKIRAEILTHFIKVAKKLHELNNLHSLMAIVQSLNSSSIIRLSSTWALISRNNRATFERLLSLVKEDGNRAELRSHMDSIKLPCIPFLGMYLADVMYINSAHPPTRGLESHERKDKLNNILRVFSEFQQSNYDLHEKPHILNYLKSVKYIEELEKFLEEDNYKLSLKIEPPSQAGSEEKPRAIYGFLPGKMRGRSDVRVNQLTTPPSQVKFVPGHRKTKSLGRESASEGVFKSTVQDNKKSGSFPRKTHPTMTTSLLDDSVIASSSKTSPSSSSSKRSRQTRLTDSLPSSNSGSERSDDVASQNNMELHRNENAANTFEGIVKRKCVLKNGKKPTISQWSKYWLSLYGTTLIYFSSKSAKPSVRSHFKSRPSKVVPILGWMLLYPVDPAKLDLFQLSDPNSGSIYRFQCESKKATMAWVSIIEEAVKGHPQPEQDLINLSDS